MNARKLGGVCDAIEYEYCGQKMVVTVDVRGSHLPVRLKSGAAIMIPWGAQGRFFIMKPAEQIRWPDGGHVELDAVKGGAFADCQPRPARILAKRFLVSFKVGPAAAIIDRWIELAPGQFIQGCYFRHDRERAVYVVSTQAPPDFDHLVSPWPRIMTAQRRDGRSR